VAATTTTRRRRRQWAETTTTTTGGDDDDSQPAVRAEPTGTGAKPAEASKSRREAILDSPTCFRRNSRARGGDPHVRSRRWPSGCLRVLLRRASSVCRFQRRVGGPGGEGVVELGQQLGIVQRQGHGSEGWQGWVSSRHERQAERQQGSSTRPEPHRTVRSCAIACLGLQPASSPSRFRPAASGRTSSEGDIKTGLESSLQTCSGPGRQAEKGAHNHTDDAFGSKTDGEHVNSCLVVGGAPFRLATLLLLHSAL